MAGLQFDVHYDSSVYDFAEVETGIAVEDAGKTVAYSQVDDNTIRILVTGFNDTTLPDGDVAWILLRNLGNGDLTNTIGLDKVLASDEWGISVPIHCLNPEAIKSDGENQAAEPTEALDADLAGSSDVSHTSAIAGSGFPELDGGSIANTDEESAIYGMKKEPPASQHGQALPSRGSPSLRRSYHRSMPTTTTGIGGNSSDGGSRNRQANKPSTEDDTNIQSLVAENPTGDRTTLGYSFARIPNHRTTPGPLLADAGGHDILGTAPAAPWKRLIMVAISVSLAAMLMGVRFSLFKKRQKQ